MTVRQPPADSYDSAPYPLLAYSGAHPARMAAVISLMGLPAPPVASSRVLEVGCAVGGHLLPLAMTLPGAEFLGIDIAATQVEAASESASQLGLRNVSFQQADIRDYAPEPGSFDFVIAHGIYSWVPGDAREALLALARRALHPGGIAYISYNTFPGWHGLMGVRRALQLGAGDIEDPIERARAGLEALQFFQDILPDDSSVRFFMEWYQRAENDRFRTAGVDHLALVTHDELSEFNEPVYFLDFVAHAARHDLQHMADADISSSFPHRLTTEQIAAINKRAHSPEEFEQYLDFVRDRTFRRSLLVHSRGDVSRRLQASPERLRSLWVRSKGKAEGPVELDEVSRASFLASDSARIETNHPLSKAAFLELLAAAPAALAYDDLLSRAATRAGRPVFEPDELLLCGNLLSAFTYSSELVDLLSAGVGVVDGVSDRPCVDAYARWMCARGETLLTNRFLDRVAINPAISIVLALLDGSRTLAEVAVEAGRHLEDRSGGGEARLEAMVQEVVGFARDTALLVPS